MRLLDPYCMHTSARGFTLLEILIAIVITSLIGLGSWQLMNSAIRASELTKVRSDELSQLQKAMFHLARDMQQLAARAIRNDFGDYEAALTTKTDFYTLEFTRTGWRNPLDDQRSELQRVAYELDEENQLIRHYWLVLDRAQDSDPKKRRLLPNVNSIEFAFLSKTGQWVREWPPESTDDDEQKDLLSQYNQMPRAVRVQIEHEQFGEITRLFETPGYIDHEDFVVASGEEGQEGAGSESGSGDGGDSSGGTPNVGEGDEETRP